MATEIDIANLSLSHLGDDATVSSFDPPEGSAQADHCARFYPIARDSLLEMFDGGWRFATRRAQLSKVDLTNEAPTTWQFAYALPNNCLKVLAILPPDAFDDTSQPPAPQGAVFDFSTQTIKDTYQNALYTPQDFEVETLSDGSQVIYTNQEQAVARCIFRITDTAKFPPLFVLALSYLLASFLAGPVLKGDVGTTEATNMLEKFDKVYQRAIGADANQKKTRPQQVVPWMNDR